MKIDYDVKELDKALNDFYTVTGVNISVLGKNYAPLGSKKEPNIYCRLIQSNKCGRIKCLDFNRFILEECEKLKVPLVRMCHAGLYEIVIPIFHKEELIGYVLLGHIRNTDEFLDIKDGIKDLPVDIALAEEYFKSLPICESERLKGIVGVASMLGEHLIYADVINLKGNEHFERIKKYVEDNIDKKLTPTMIAKGTYLSRSTVYLSITSELGYTINDYICITKIEKAKEMLVNTDMNIGAVSEKLGFSSPSYFTRKFKQIVGVSPKDFKENNSI